MFLTLGGTLIREQLEEERIQKERFKKILEDIKKQASISEQNHAETQFELGHCYYNGNGVGQNYNQAAGLFLKVAEQGNPNAQFWPDVCYFNDQGFSQNVEEALNECIKPANQGNVDVKKFLADHEEEAKEKEKAKIESSTQQEEMEELKRQLEAFKMQAELERAKREASENQAQLLLAQQQEEVLRREAAEMEIKKEREIREALLQSKQQEIEDLRRKAEEEGRKRQAAEEERRRVEELSNNPQKPYIFAGDYYEEAQNMALSIAVPLVALEYERIIQRFLNGRLVYKPNLNSDAEMVTFPIRELSNPMEGTFDLSHCGDSGKYLSIYTGYHKGKNPENKDKVAIWICPWFLIKKELNSTAAHFKSIIDRWNPKKAPIGLFWTWDDLDPYDYLTNQSMDEISNNNLYEKWWSSRVDGVVWVENGIWRVPRVHGARFHVLFTADDAGSAVPVDKMWVDE